MNIPVINLDIFNNWIQLEEPEAETPERERAIQECKRAAEALINYGALILHDSRVAEKDNATFLDLMEDYFNQSPDDLRKDERSVSGHIMGFTKRVFSSTDQGCPDVSAKSISAESSTNSRFLWQMSTDAPNVTPSPALISMSLNAPDVTQRSALNSSNVVTSEIRLRPQWRAIMNKWGQSMRNAVADLVHMIEIGLNDLLPTATFKLREAGRYGRHILAPNSTDLVKYGQRGRILTEYHTDICFLTIHGRSRYPGLDIWARGTDQRIGVEIPSDDNFVVQAGKQLEHITCGVIKAGFHEVVVNDQTLAAIERRKVEFPDRPLIRVSSTLFWHLSPDSILDPNPACKDKAGILRAKNIEAGLNEGDEVIYEPMKVEQLVRNEMSTHCSIEVK